MKKLSSLVLGLSLAAPMAVMADDAQSASSRLDRIKEHKTMILGYYETGIPFSYLDNNGVQGFGAEISKRIAEQVRIELGLDEMEIRWNPMTVSTRIALVAANTIDLECTSTSHKTSREKYVSFSNTFFVSSDAIAARKDSGITDAASVSGKKVAAVKGSANVTNAQAVGANVLEVANNPRAMEALVNGTAEAFFSNVGLVSREMLRVEDASSYQVNFIGSDKSGYACMLPKGDKELKRIADETIANMQLSGEMEQLFNKWFNGPIPPYGRSANVTIDALNKDLYANPSDIAYE
jgi:glutamate/aspartate transport system substrate-binding protein